MAVVSCINGGSLSNGDYVGVSGMGNDWYIVFAARVPVTLSFDVQAFFNLQTPTVNNIEIHAWCPPGVVDWEVHNPANWTPFGTGTAQTGWKWFAVRGTASAIEFYAMSDGDSSWISYPAHNLSPERLAQLRLAPSFVGDFSDGRISKIIAKRGSFSLANMLAETRKIGIASDAADTILYLPNTSAAGIDTNQASPTGGSATYKFSNGSHTGTPVDVPGDSPAFADDDIGINYTATVKPAGQGGDFTELHAAVQYYGLMRVFGTVVTGRPQDTLTITISGDWSAGPDVAQANCEEGNEPSDFGSVLIECDSANAFDGVYDPNKYVLSSVSGDNYAVISFSLPNITIRGLQFVSVAPGSGGGIVVSVGSELLVENCYASTSQYASYGFVGAAFIRCVNCIAHNCTDDAGFGGDQIGAGSGGAIAEHCISVNCAYGFGSPFDGITTVENCLAYNCGTDFNAAHVTGDYNISEDSTAPGAHSIHGATYTFQLGTYLLNKNDTSGAIGGGVDSSILTDVQNKNYLRPPTIGFYEPRYVKPSAYVRQTFFGWGF